MDPIPKRKYTRKNPIVQEKQVEKQQPPGVVAPEPGKKRCPRGTRRNRNGDCVPIQAAVVEVPQVEAAPPVVAAPPVEVPTVLQAAVVPAPPAVPAPPTVPAPPVVEVPPVVQGPPVAPVEPPRVEIPVEDLEKLTTQMDENKCDNPDNYYTPKCNELLLQKEELETIFGAGIKKTMFELKNGGQDNG